jgi:hypothetical protein
MQASVPRWPMFGQVLRRQRLMDAVMEASYVDVIAAIRVDEGQAFMDARSRCRNCFNEIRCRNWLGSSEPKSGPPDFCPNAALFTRCRRSDG